MKAPPKITLALGLWPKPIQEMAWAITKKNAT
jgi:hypothetical protein